MMLREHVEKLGFKAKDKVTGVSGVITTVCFDLYGCVQAAITPPVEPGGDVKETRWFDVARLEVTDTERVMDVPDFSKGYVAEGKKGAAEKPSPT
jgi:hypothetical protein